MKTTFTSAFLFVCLLLNMAPAFARNTPAKGPASSSSKVFKQELKTDNLRILSLELAPGEFLDFHATPDQEAYAASAGSIKMVTSDGQEKMVNVKPGDRLWMDLTHFKNWNTGEQTLKIMLIEQQSEDVKINSKFLSVR